MKPVLEDIKKRYPHKSSIEFFSDGPSSQYRQRFNFFMFSSVIYRLGFSNAEWNFFEAGHGKGVPDAVGGAIKRKADQKVKFGSTIMLAKSFVKCLKKSQTQLFELPDTEIETARQELKKVDIKPIPGTLKLHQLKTFSQGNLLYREISCECIEPNTCTGHEMKIHKFQTANNNPPSKVEKPKKHRKNKDSNTKTQSEQMTKTDNVMEMKSKQMKQTANKKSTKEHEQMKMTDKNKATDSVETNQSVCKKATEYEQMKQSGNLEAKERNMNSNNVKINLEQNYPLLLNKLRNCRGFEQLKVKCYEISQSFSELPTVPQSVTVLSSNLEVDIDAMDLYPNDVPDSRVLFPCIVPADGNCLPSSGSVFGYGCPDFSAEIRLRILCELALNEDTYLNNGFLLKGLPDNEKSRNLAKSYAMYSDMWVPGMLLNDDMIKSIYQMELRKIKVNYSFMGMWQIHALSSVLKVPIYSIYPHKSSPEIRRDLNRLVLPRQSSSNMTPVYIFWTTTRDSEMVCEHWAPNHFVPCVPIDENSVYSPRTINISGHQNDLPSRVEFVDLTTEDSSQFTEKHKITEIYMRLKGVNTMAEDRQSHDINNNVTEYHTCREDHKVDTMIETDERRMETGTTKVDRENGEMETEDRRMGTDYSKAEAENSKMETRIKKTDDSKVNKRAKTIEVEVERIAREMEAGKIKMTTEYSKVETHDSKIETHDSMAMTVDSKMEAWNEKKTDYSKMTKGADSMKMDTEYIKVKTEYNKMETESNKMEKEDSKMETGGSKMETGDSKMETGGSKMETGDSKMETGDSKMETGDSKMETGDSKMETGDSKMETWDSEMETGDSKMETGDSKMKTGDIKMETGDSKMETGDTKMETGDSKMETGDSKMETGDSEMETGNSKMETGDSKMETGDSKMETGDSKMETGDSKMETGDSKMETGDSEMETGDSEMETGDSKMETGDSKMETGDSKMETGDSKMETGDSKMETGDSEMETGDSEMETGDSKMETGDSKMETGDSKMETGDSKMETGDSKMETGDSKMETGDSKMETGDSKMETGDSKMETGDSEMETGDSKMETGDSKMETGDSEMETGDNKMATEFSKMETGENKMEKGVSKMETDNSMRKTDNSKIEEQDKKTDCSKGDKGDKKMKAGHRKMDIEFIKVKTDNSKMETEESKMETEYEKMKREESKLGIGDIEIGIDDSLMTNDIAQDVLTKDIKKVTANDHSETPVTLPLDCIGKHVIVKYGRQAYPGIVEDAGEYDVFVKCMHGIGRKNSNCFYWPKKIIDRCWYDHENILALIPEPTKMEGTNSHFKVEEKTWNFITN